jgi:hypothetical protein
LLSFAQFEREVTGERIRDKISASKKKGMWMGGVPPLGFDVVERKLIVNEAEAALVRRIFSDYHRINSVTMLIQHYRMEGIYTKHWTTQDGKQRVGKLINKGYVYKLLNNPLYCGMIHFKGEKFRGEHTPIITQEMWEKTQAKLASSTRGSKKEQRHSKHTALLKGLIYSSDGSAMSPVGKAIPGTTKHYRYYRAVIDQKVKARTSGLPMIPAHEVEKAVMGQVRKLLKSTDIINEVYKAVKVLDNPNTKHLDVYQTSNLMANVDQVWDSLYPLEQHRILHLLVKKVVIYPDRIDISLHPSGVANLVIEVSQKQMELQ